MHCFRYFDAVKSRKRPDTFLLILCRYECARSDLLYCFRYLYKRIRALILAKDPVAFYDEFIGLRLIPFRA